MPEVEREGYILLNWNMTPNTKIPLSFIMGPLGTSAVRQYGQKIDNIHKIKIPVFADTNPGQNDSRPIITGWIEHSERMTSRSDKTPELARKVIDYARRHEVQSIYIPSDDDDDE